MSIASDVRTRRRRPTPFIGIALSLAVHILIVIALAAGVRQGFEAGPTPIADIRLIPAWPTPVSRQRRPSPRAPRAMNPGPRAHTTPTEPLTPAPPSLGQPPATPDPLHPPAQTLRLGLGCAHADFMRLTAEERAACRDRFAARNFADRDYADAAIDPEARAAFDAGVAREKTLQTPFLSAMPKKGCRPRITEHDAAAFGKSQPDFTVQATCVVHF